MTLANHLQHSPFLPFSSRSLSLPPSLSLSSSPCSFLSFSFPRSTYRAISTTSTIGSYAEGGYLLVWLPTPNKAVRRLRQLGLTSNLPLRASPAPDTLPSRCRTSIPRRYRHFHLVISKHGSLTLRMIVTRNALYYIHLLKALFLHS